MTSVLLVTGGPDYAHDFGASAAALAAVIGATGADVKVVDHPDRAAELLPGGFDAVVVNALRWRMLHERYDQWRAQWGYHTPASTRAAFTEFVAAGGGLMGSHTASICFDDWPEWREVLGGAWNWERSSHPPVAPVAARVVSARAAQHAVLAGLPPTLELVDEVYGEVDLADGCEVLMVARRTPDDADQPVLWAHQFGAGRVVYDGFGHDATSINEPQHAALIRQAVRWVCGEPNSEGAR
ncbi:MAG: ThuA domain-containing protein [Actinomycetota bacterium]